MVLVNRNLSMVATFVLPVGPWSYHLQGVMAWGRIWCMDTPRKRGPKQGSKQRVRPQAIVVLTLLKTFPPATVAALLGKSLQSVCQMRDRHPDFFTDETATARAAA